MFSKVVIFALVAIVVVKSSVVPVVPVVVEHYPPQPYSFGYNVKDHHGEQHREEVSDGVNVKGSYGFADARGIHRQVDYVADHAGFRAEVKTNEPGTANQNPAAVRMISTASNHPVAPVVVARAPVVAVERPVVAVERPVVAVRPVAVRSYGY